jgi:hypothetical protein
MRLLLRATGHADVRGQRGWLSAADASQVRPVRDDGIERPVRWNQRGCAMVRMNAVRWGIGQWRPPGSG